MSWVTSRWRAGFWGCLVGLMPVALIAQPGLAASPDEVAKATPLIIETGNQICSAVSDAGSSQSAKISGEIKAGIEGLLSRLARIGVSAQGERDTSRYQGVLQTDLATALKDRDECKTRVFNKMFDALFPGATTGTVASPYVGYQPTGRFRDRIEILR